jgi:hypothetical protein
MEVALAKIPPADEQPIAEVVHSTVAKDAVPCDALDCIVDDINDLVLRLRQTR